jgi:hypothetical protein
MPLRAYFLVITPALAAFLWLASWYMQPEPPKTPKTYTTASVQAVKPAAAKPAAATTGAAPAEAAPAVPDIKLVASTAVDDAKPVHQAAKPKKRKHVARYKPRGGHGSAYAYGAPAGGSPYGGYYAGYQPFSGYRSW